MASKRTTAEILANRAFEQLGRELVTARELNHFLGSRLNMKKDDCEAIRKEWVDLGIVIPKTSKRNLVLR